MFGRKKSSLNSAAGAANPGMKTKRQSAPFLLEPLEGRVLLSSNGLVRFWTQLTENIGHASQLTQRAAIDVSFAAGDGASQSAPATSSVHDSSEDSSTVPGWWDVRRSVGESKVNFGDTPSDDLKSFFDHVGHGITFGKYLGNEASLSIHSPKDMTLDEVKTLVSAMPGLASIGPVAIMHAMPTSNPVVEPGLWVLTRTTGESKLNFSLQPSADLKSFFDQVGHGITFASYLGNESRLAINTPADMTLEQVKSLMSDMPGFSAAPDAITHVVPFTPPPDAGVWITSSGGTDTSPSPTDSSSLDIITIPWNGQMAKVQAGEWVVERSVGGFPPLQYSPSGQPIYQPNLKGTHASTPAADLKPFFDNVGLGITFDHYLGNEAFLSIKAPVDIDFAQLKAALSKMPGFSSVGPNFVLSLDNITQ